MFRKLVILYVLNRLFILVGDRQDKILSFCVFVLPGDVTFLLQRGTRLERRVWVVQRYFYPGLFAYQMVVTREERRNNVSVEG